MPQDITATLSLIDKMTAPLKEIQSNTKALSDQLRKIDEATKPIQQVQKEFGKLDAQIRKIDRNLGFQKIRQGLGQIGSEVGVLATRLGAIGGITAAGFGVLLKPAAELEVLRTRLDALYGSAQAGGKAFDYLTNFATKSPYSFRILADNLAKLKGQGLDSLKSFENIQNFLGAFVPEADRAANATLAISQAWGRAKLQAQDINQLIDAGVPVYKLLGEVLGKSTAQIQAMSQKGQINREVMSRLFDLMGRKAGPAGAAIQNLLTTKVSNLGDAFQIFSYRVLNSPINQLPPVFQQIKADIDRIQSAFTNAAGAGKSEFATALSEIYAGAKEIAQGVIPVLGDIFKGIRAISKAVGGWGNLFKGVVGLTVFTSLAAIIAPLASITTAVIGLNLALGTSATLLGGLAAAGSVLTGIAPVVAGIGAVAGGAVLARNLISNRNPVNLGRSPSSAYVPNLGARGVLTPAVAGLGSQKIHLQVDLTGGPPATVKSITAPKGVSLGLTNKTGRHSGPGT